ncbi:U32 family peptidase [Streptococcus suis]|uniref:U32 family peptidase n=1 Tax=Streptococcus suis TaxID=1307 RepID=A0A6L8MYL9_STRSU|nr:peptidase U32 family protein [Streptococcus parasuis]MDG4477942.1 U32 family peptidase [Streptococcus parasuis]MYN70240.1 U32 family peptidase [Streptococcus suis]NQM55334.1 U32 family peptidase [Streptococcus suis]NQQ33479.1 U32 family peptidase [Streptococcus suis]
MKKITITATAESIEQVKELLVAGVDRIYVGEENHALRIPTNFSYDELREIAELVHGAGKELTVAANALMHQDMMDRIKPFMELMREIKVDYLVVGDAGLFYINKRDGYNFKLIYDTSVFVTSSRQINFWKDHGAVEAVLAREIPSEELFDISKNLEIPAEVLVYGASVIHHSKRTLLRNYYNFTKADETDLSRQRGLFLAEPADPESHYSIFEDKHGTHIFINNDIDMMPKLAELYSHGYCNWKLDGIFCPGQNFVEIAKLFVQAKELLEQGTFTYDQAFLLDEQVRKLHPAERGLDTGFYEFDRNKVK